MAERLSCVNSYESKLCFAFNRPDDFANWKLHSQIAHGWEEKAVAACLQRLLSDQTDQLIS
jgi:hypothetical protein